MQDGIREALPAAFRAARIATPLRDRVVRGLVIGTVAAVVLAIAGVFNTDQAAFLPRLAYWLAVILPGSILGIFVHTAIATWGGLADRRWLEMAVVAIIVAIPHAFVVIVASMLIFGTGVLSIATVFGFGAVVLMFSFILTTINYISSPPEMPIHTDLGSDIILMRMVDAVTLLDTTPGARVHRSWWVARKAVEGSSSIDGRAMLRLATGLAVPVSRSTRPALAAQGWFL